MKKILLAILFIGSSLFGAIGDAGSERVSFQAMIKVELIKEDNSTVTILDGTKFIELKTDGNSSGLGASLEAVRPANGTYKGVKYTVTKFKHKLKIVSGNTTYYTTDKEVENGASWDLSTDENNYGYTTTLAPSGGYITTVTFPKPLVLEKGSDASLVWVNQYLPNNINYETNGNIENSKWIDETQKARGFLTAMPTKTIEFDIIYTKSSENNLTNTITVFLDKDNDLLGAFSMRPDTDKALNSSSLTSGSKVNNDYTFRFSNGNDSDDGTDGDDYYDLNITLNCTDSSYSNLVINEVIDGAAPTTAKPNNQDGYTLTTSGNIICTDINITE
jgi:hypothetical protein